MKRSGWILMLAALVNGPAYGSFIVDHSAPAPVKPAAPAVAPATAPVPIVESRELLMSAGPSFSVSPSAPDGYRLVADKRTRLVEESGVGKADVHRGEGSDLPLNAALGFILPPGWVAYAAPTVDMEAPVTWQGGVPWTEVLENLAVDEHLRFLVDWRRESVFVRPLESDAVRVRLPPRRAERLDLAVDLAASGDTSVAEVESGAAVRVSAPVPDVVLSIERGAWIGETLERWGAENGWNVIWGPGESDYRAFADGEFRGSAVPDVVTDVIGALRRAGIQLIVDQFPNRVLLIEILK